jgi:hypothetical protein
MPWPADLAATRPKRWEPLRLSRLRGDSRSITPPRREGRRGEAHYPGEQTRQTKTVYYIAALSGLRISLERLYASQSSLTSQSLPEKPTAKRGGTLGSLENPWRDQNVDRLDPLLAATRPKRWEPLRLSRLRGDSRSITLNLVPVAFTRRSGAKRQTA